MARDKGEKPGTTGGPLEESFERIFRLYYPSVVRFFQRRGYDDDESRDLAQETFLRVFQGLTGFRGQARPETWLFQIATNIWRSEVRRRSTTKRAARMEELRDEHSEAGLVPLHGSVPLYPIDQVLAQERTRLLHEAMADLPPQMRRCVTLLIGQDLKYREIAAVLELSVQAVRSHLFEARDQLRRRLAGRFSDIGF